jgi:sigma-B regulation protein RsbU (phosphoserine phosphatase)
MKSSPLVEHLLRLLFGHWLTERDPQTNRLLLFPKQLPEHLDAIYFEEYIRSLRMPVIWGTILVFAVVLIAICAYASSYRYIRQWFLLALAGGAITLLEIFWFWDVSRRWGYRTQLTILNFTLGVFVNILSWGIIGAWETMPAHFIGMMTTIIGAILGATAVILSYSRVSFLVFMFSWIVPGIIYMFSRDDLFSHFMGWLFIAGIFSFTIINTMEYAKQRQLFDARQKLAEFNAELSRKEAELDQELVFASHIQMGIFPETKVHHGPYTFQTTILPLGRISGDYCDIITRGDIAYALVADASGHGVPAAMLTIAAKNVFSNILTENISTSRAMALANHEILRMIKTQDFMTGFLLKLYPSGLVEFTNAAHPTAIFQSRQGDMRLLDTSGFILGGLDDVDALYEGGSVQMQRGDRIFLYTDGVIECVNSHNQFYSMDRLEKMLRITRGLELSRVTTRIFSDMVTFCEGVPFRDDIAMMVIEFNP